MAKIKDLLNKFANEGLSSLDLGKFKKYNLDIYNEYLYLNSGREHYQLLANISSCFENGKFYDIGTNYGASALALAFNNKNNVTSYDIINLLPCAISEENIKFKIGNCLDDENLLSADLIFLDTAHDGNFEEIFLNFLVNKKYNGVVVMDDVNEYPILRQIAKSISQTNKFEIVDLTHVGHYSGTIAIIFN
jgi:predicted O-methyltransferase YrrM